MLVLLNGYRDALQYDDEKILWTTRGLLVSRAVALWQYVDVGMVVEVASIGVEGGCTGEGGWQSS